MLSSTSSHIALCSLGLLILSDGTLAFSPSSFAPSTARFALRHAAAITPPRGALVSLRCMSDDEEKKEEKFVKLETTATSWQGWGSSDTKKTVAKLDVDKENPKAAIQKALDNARESEDIAKYLGTTESKRKAGITGDVELAGYEGKKVVLRLTGQFWHSRQMVFSDVEAFMRKVLPEDCVGEVVIEDKAQLEGFAETSRTFESAEKITEEDLRNREAKGKNIYGEKLENPMAKFRRKKLEDQQKFDEEMQRRRELDGKDEAEQLAAILSETGAGQALGKSASGKMIPQSELRPEDILAQMLKE